mmetsp:Transcript_69802/g.175834  ORF Transcript_69802/g.175834 Transcript_69802/m.175834 type:complete len:200 (-) Transcript_69802:1617-2216(-)
MSMARSVLLLALSSGVSSTCGDSELCPSGLGEPPTLSAPAASLTADKVELSKPSHSTDTSSDRKLWPSSLHFAPSPPASTSAGEGMLVGWSAITSAGFGLSSTCSPSLTALGPGLAPSVFKAKLPGHAASTSGACELRSSRSPSPFANMPAETSSVGQAAVSRCSEGAALGCTLPPTRFALSLAEPSILSLPTAESPLP